MLGNLRDLLPFRSLAIKSQTGGRFLTAMVLILGVTATSAGPANAALYYDPGTPAISTSGLSFSVNHPYVKAILSDEANTDIGSENLANVATALGSLSWFNTTLSGGAGGACGASPTYANGCTQVDLGGGPSNKQGTSNLTGNLFGVHFGNTFIAVLFSSPISDFQINDLRYAVSNIYVFDAKVAQTPIPAAAWLFGSGLAFLGFVRRKKNSSQDA